MWEERPHAGGLRCPSTGLRWGARGHFSPAELPAGNHHADATGKKGYTQLTYGPLELTNQLFQATELGVVCYIAAITETGGLVDAL